MPHIKYFTHVQCNIAISCRSLFLNLWHGISDGPKVTMHHAVYIAVHKIKIARDNITSHTVGYSAHAPVFLGARN
jgi:hypothetical protein